jgi:phospholipid/cholesterol/gamma-HCH transport system substrate-binding protein
MYSHANYTVVGLFVVILSIALIAAGLWFSVDMSGNDEKRYLVLPDEPMTGLSYNSAVKYQGVDVGRIRELGLDDEGEVRILISVQRNVPVHADTRARLASQVLTGLGHLELLPGTAAAGPPVTNYHPYPVLPNAPSLRSRLESGVEEGLVSVNILAQQLEALLSDENITTINATIDHLERISGTLAENVDQIAVTLRETGLLAQEARQVLEEAPETMARVQATLASVDDAAERVSAAAEALKQTSAISNRAVERMDKETLPQVNQLLLDIQGLTHTLERLGIDLSEHPNRLIFGAPRREPGPGEDD